MKKRNLIVSALVAGVMLLSTPVNTLAMVGSEVLENGASTKIAVTTTTETKDVSSNLETVLKTVKGKMNIPSTYTEFSSNYYTNYNGKNVWEFAWGTSETPYTVSITANDKGNILSYYKYNETNKKISYLRDELKKKADDFINKIEPKISSKLVYRNALTNSYTKQYVYSYDRYEHGIKVEGDQVSVAVSAVTGEIEAYSSTYDYDVVIPSHIPTVDIAKAKELLKEKTNMRLVYKDAPYYVITRTKSQTPEIYLAYEPENGNLSLDAKTGKLYDSIFNIFSYEESKESITIGSMDGATADSNLTNIEIKQIDTVSNLITKEKAINLIKDNKALEFDKNATDINARLYEQQMNNKKTYIWYLTFIDNKKVDSNTVDSFRSYVNARVDASTGKILSYSTNVKNAYTMTDIEIKALKEKYSVELNQKAVEAFLTSEAKSMFNSSVLTNKAENNVITKEDGTKITLERGFEYTRQVNNALYTSNSLNVTISAITGKITNYDHNWTEGATFTSTEGVFDKDKAYDHYMDSDNLKLVYERYYDEDGYSIYNNTSKLRLVYKNVLDIQMISPFTGNPLYYNGTEVQTDDVVYEYTDIEDSVLKRDILILAQLGIGYSGGTFDGNKAVTGKELVTFLEKINYYSSANNKLLNTTNEVKRADVAEAIIELLGYKEIAKLQGIYNINVSDIGSVNGTQLGSVALAKGMGLLKVDSANQIRPNDSITRFEMVTLFIQLLELNRY